MLIDVDGWDVCAKKRDTSKVTFIFTDVTAWVGIDWRSCIRWSGLNRSKKSSQQVLSSSNTRKYLNQSFRTLAVLLDLLKCRWGYNINLVFKKPKRKMHTKTKRVYSYTDVSILKIVAQAVYHKNINWAFYFCKIQKDASLKMETCLKVLDTATLEAHHRASLSILFSSKHHCISCSSTLLSCIFSLMGL